MPFTLASNFDANNAHGAAAARYVRHVDWPLLRNYLAVTPPVKQLEEHNSFLRDLNDRFVQIVESCTFPPSVLCDCLGSTCPSTL